MKSGLVVVAAGFASLSLITQPAQAGAHTWDVIEIFSSEDGKVQFIELLEQNGTPNEVNIGGHTITSTTTGHVFVIPSNLEPPTSSKRLLFATQCFADLPGAPVPDFIIQENFFSVDGDTISYTPYDTLTFGIGVLPTDGVTSLLDGGSTAVNSPTNYDGNTGSVTAPPCEWDLGCDNEVTVIDLLDLLSRWGSPYDVVDLLALLAAWGSC